MHLPRSTVGRDREKPGPVPVPTAMEQIGAQHGMLKNGYIDWVDFVAECVLRVSGWTALNPLDEISVRANGDLLPYLNYYRTHRPDVAAHLGSANEFFGFGIEYLLPEGHLDISINVENKTVYSATATIPAGLHQHEQIRLKKPLRRDQVYPHTFEVFKAGFPPPPPEPALLAFLKQCQGPFLDFGCGNGALVQYLTENGQEAAGLEVAAMEPYVLPSVKQKLRFYDGSFPTSFSSGSFKTVICAEVLEHIVDYNPVIAEMARIASDRVVISVPDNGILQICETLDLIPRHYLTGDHYTFFNQISLTQTLKPFFSSIAITRTSAFQIDGVPIYSNLLADCRK